MSAGAQISWDETPKAPPQIQWDEEQQKKSEEKPGVATRFTQSLLDNTVGTHTNEGVIEGFTKGIPHIAAHPLDSAGMILDSEAAARQHQLEEAAQHYQEPGIGNKVSGFAHHLYGSVPFLGPALGGAADQFEKGDIAGGLGSSVGIAAMTHGGSPEVQENAALAVKSPVKAAAGVVKDIAPDLGAKAGALAKVAGQHAISKIPVVGNMVRRPSLFDYGQALRTKAPVFPGARFPEVPPEGLPPQAPPAVSAPPLVSDTPAPFRLGPGQIPPDAIGAPDPRVLANNQGVRTTPIALLPESTGAPPVQSPSVSPKLPPPHIELPPRFSPRYDLMEDKAFQDSANADLERHGRRAFKEERDQFEAGNKVDVPKGELTKQFREGIGKPENLAPGWSRPVPVRSKPLTMVGTSAGASADTNYFQAARQALGDKASVSDAAQLAQKLKESGIEPGASLEELLRKSIELAKQKKKF